MALTDSPVRIRGQYQATVSANVSLCREHFGLKLRLPHFLPTEAGQFIQISCNDAPSEDLDRSGDWQLGARPNDETFQSAAMLRRPFSLAGRSDDRDGVELYVIHRVVGIGTDWLSKLEIGDPVSIVGPLGNCFQFPSGDGAALLVGGGVGIPPMLYLAGSISRLPQRVQATAFCGATTRDLLPFTLDGSQAKEFSRCGVDSVLCTDDGSFGFRGLVTTALENHLKNAPPPPGSVIYTCGPEGMMKRVAAIAAEHGIECQVAVERAMACGLGTCQSCCIRLRRDPKRDGNAFAGKDWIYKLACTDGPIFRGADLLW
jgi:dihydroorotate dehydrogenase electron transfer subunit